MTVTNDKADDEQNYLFSTCIPTGFDGKNIMNICKEVADGNDYRDYLDDDGEPIV